MQANDHKKIYAVAVICVGAIVSAFLLARKPDFSKIQSNQNLNLEHSGVELNTESTIENKDWGNLLAKIESPSKTGGAEIDIPEDGTLTARLARDLFSRYLTVAKSGQDIPEEESAKIIDAILASPEYTQGSRGVVYVESNLKIGPVSNTETIKKYADDVNRIFKTGMDSIKANEGIGTIINLALANQDETKIAKLDPFVIATRTVLKNLVSVNVPIDLVKLHLELVNSVSNVLSDLESMRETFNDPVRGFIGATKYPQDTDDTQIAIQKITSYYLNKIK